MENHSLEQALRMVSVFLDAGSSRFDLTRIDLEGNKVDYSPARNAGAMRLLLPELLPITRAARQNLIIRPNKPLYGVLAQLDDLYRAKLERVCSWAFLSLQTSPGNYQAWLAIEGADDSFVRRLVRGIGVDWNASRAVRLAGSLNFKPKYAPDFPEIRIVDRCTGLRAKPADLEHLLAPLPAAASTRPAQLAGRPRRFPDYQRCFNGAPRKPDGTPNRSKADYLWCRISLQWGFSIYETAAELVNVSEKAREEHDRGNTAYAGRTAIAAAQGLGSNVA